MLFTVKAYKAVLYSVLGETTEGKLNLRSQFAEFCSVCKMCSFYYRIMSSKHCELNNGKRKVVRQPIHFRISK